MSLQVLPLKRVILCGLIFLGIILGHSLTGASWWHSGEHHCLTASGHRSLNPSVQFGSLDGYSPPSRGGKTMESGIVCMLNVYKWTFSLPDFSTTNFGALHQGSPSC